MPNRKQPEYSQDEIVLNLASQLSNGAIDSSTFKRAYQDIFPRDHQEELLHKLVELLGAQRLSSDLFRATYEAVRLGGDRPPTAPVPSQPLPSEGSGSGSIALLVPSVPNDESE